MTDTRTPSPEVAVVVVPTTAGVGNIDPPTTTGRQQHHGAGAHILYKPNMNRASTRRLAEGHAITRPAQGQESNRSNAISSSSSSSSSTNGRDSKIEIGSMRSGSIEILNGVPNSRKRSAGHLETNDNDHHHLTTIPSTPQSSESYHYNSQDSSPGFNGLCIGQVLMCRDEFFSKYTEGKMYRWREAKIVAIEGAERSRVQVHFVGWADSFDQWLDLHLEWFKLAPVGLLSKADCDRGVNLTDSQQEAVTQFLFVGQGQGQGQQDDRGHVTEVGPSVSGEGSSASSSSSSSSSSQHPSANQTANTTRAGTRRLAAGNAYTRSAQSKPPTYIQFVRFN